MQILLLDLLLNIYLSTSCFCTFHNLLTGIGYRPDNGYRPITKGAVAWLKSLLESTHQSLFIYYFPPCSCSLSRLNSGPQKKAKSLHAYFSCECTKSFTIKTFTSLWNNLQQPLLPNFDMLPYCQKTIQINIQISGSTDFMWNMSQKI